MQYQQKIINAQNKHYVMNLRNINNLKTYERPMKNDFDVILIIPIYITATIDDIIA